MSHVHIFMQISAAITENSFVGHISVNNDDNWTNKVSTPMLWGAEIIEIPWNTMKYQPAPMAQRFEA